ncbi:sulfotransferase domain-containing protein [Bradyrhizobium sp. P5_C12]
MQLGVLAPGADRPAHSEPTKQNIIWIASYPKSGNTWVRVFIHNLLNELSGVDEAQDINRMDTHTLWEFGAKPFERVLGKSLAAADQSEVAAARPEVQRQLANGRSEPVLVKTHLCIGNEYQHPTINLNATLAAIYIVRNPLDVAISYAHHSGVRIDAMIASMATPGLKTPETARAAYQVLGSWSQNVASWLGLADRPMHIMRYEDLVANPVRPFGTLARFLGLTPSEQQLRAAIAKSSFGELRRQESENGFIERPKTAKIFFREGRAGQWRDVLSPAQIQEITRAHAPMMQRFGYLAPDCGRPLRPQQTA